MKLAEKYEYLPYMVKRYVQFLGLNDTIKLLNANEQPLVPSIRVNTLKIVVPAIKKRLELKGFKLEPINWVPYGFKVVREASNLGSLHEYLHGYYYLQNIASMIPAMILNPKPDDVVIDMCAAPGSKATQLAQIMMNRGKLLLIDKNKKRIPALELNLRRMGVKNSIVLNMDALNLEKLQIKADRILLDAPCTGEGLIRQDISRKKSRRMQDINKMASIQKGLLQTGLNSLKSGGYLLYSTCSIAPEENELVIDNVLRKNKECSILKLSINYGVEGLTKVGETNLIEDLKFSQRFYPHIHDTIGFFLCLIRK